MSTENEDTVSVTAFAKILNALGFKGSSIKAMEEEEKEVEPTPVVEEEEKEDVEALKAEIESLKAKVQAMEEGDKEKEEEEKVEAKSKEDLIFTALQENKVTIAKAKEFFAMDSADKIAEALKSIDNNASGFGATGSPDKTGTTETPEEIFARYEQADAKEKYSIFKAHKAVIIAQQTK
jgi:hypothetical protein